MHNEMARGRVDGLIRNEWDSMDKLGKMQWQDYIQCTSLKTVYSETDTVGEILTEIRRRTFGSTRYFREWANDHFVAGVLRVADRLRVVPLNGFMTATLIGQTGQWLERVIANYTNIRADRLPRIREVIEKSLCQQNEIEARVGLIVYVALYLAIKKVLQTGTALSVRDCVFVARFVAVMYHPLDVLLFSTVTTKEGSISFKEFRYESKPMHCLTKYHWPMTSNPSMCRALVLTAMYSLMMRYMYKICFFVCL